MLLENQQHAQGNGQQSEIKGGEFYRQDLLKFI